MSYILTSHARVATERPARYAKQLVAHLGRNLPPEEIEGGHRLAFPTERGGDVIGGEGLVIVPANDPGHLELTARADTDEMLAQVQDVLGRHLLGFGERDGLVVEWSAPSRA